MQQLHTKVCQLIKCRTLFNGGVGTMYLHLLKRICSNANSILKYYPNTLNLLLSTLPFTVFYNIPTVFKSIMHLFNILSEY